MFTFLASAVELRRDDNRVGMGGGRNQNKNILNIYVNKYSVHMYTHLLAPILQPSPD